MTRNIRNKIGSSTMGRLVHVTVLGDDALLSGMLHASVLYDSSLDCMTPTTVESQVLLVQSHMGDVMVRDEVFFRWKFHA